ncbi:MAG TPA: alpha/beta hydrolase [Acidimicrobiales bacterium]|nr:alpha/beta hydrolase [Acidimicrobiales bacterium]
MREHTVVNGDVELHVVEEGAGYPVILAHGFPELSYSWRHQLPALAAAGYRAVAPDQRGYGRSTRPDAIDDYDILHLTGDLLAVLDDLGEEKAVFVGHDWGSMVVWQLALLAPERVAGVVGMSVPFLPRGPMPPVQLMRQAFADSFFYIVYFQEPGVADADLGRDPRTTMRRMLAGLSPGDRATAARPMVMEKDDRGFVERLPEPDGLPAWLSQEELDHYVEEFTRTGFTGGVNWYRNFDRNWDLTPQLDGAKVEVPSLFIGGALDPVLAMTPPSISEGWLSDHRGDVIIEGAGHWVQQEKPDEVNRSLLAFLAGLPLRP